MRLVRNSVSHFPVDFVFRICSNRSVAAASPKLLSDTSQLRRLSLALRLKLIPQAIVLRTVTTASAGLSSHTDTYTCVGIMEMSKPTRNASASLRVFFSIRIQVAPHPDNREAYSERKAAVSRKTDSSRALLQVIEVIVLVNISRQIEDIFVLAYFENMSRFVVTVTTFRIIPLDSPED